MRSVTLSGLMVLALSTIGCASSPYTDPEVVKKMMETNHYIATTNTIEIECPESGCNFKRFSYLDPRDKYPIELPEPTNGWDAVISVADNVTGVIRHAVVPASTAWLGYQAIKAASERVSVGENGSYTYTTENVTSSDHYKSSEETVYTSSEEILD